MAAGSFFPALGLTLFAGLWTCAGCLPFYFTRRRDEQILSFALGFSAGVMVYLSFLEILPRAKLFLEGSYSNLASRWILTLAFFTGLGVVTFFQKSLAEARRELPPAKGSRGKRAEAERRQKLMLTGCFSALAIALHNFPEGILTFFSALKNPSLGLAVGFAIAVHNIAQGMAIAFPIFFATNNPRAALQLTLLAGMAQPIGGVLGFLFLSRLLDDSFFGLFLSLVAGIMVAVSVGSLLPEAFAERREEVGARGFFLGMFVMALTLVALI